MPYNILQINPCTGIILFTPVTPLDPLPLLHGPLQNREYLADHARARPYTI